MNAIDIAEKLISFDTSDHDYVDDFYSCMNYIETLLEQSHHPVIDSRLLAHAEKYPNLIVRLEGNHHDTPLLFHGHIDTVKPNGNWENAPWSTGVIGDKLYGLGSLDMKGGLACMLSAIINTMELNSDVILCLTSGEEEDDDNGARWLVNTYPDIFKGVKHAISELGGYPIYYKGRKLYTISVEEKIPQTLWITLKGDARHTTTRDRWIKKIESVLHFMRTYNHGTMITQTTHRMCVDMYEILYGDSNEGSIGSVLSELAGTREFIASFTNTSTLAVVEGLSDLYTLPSEVLLGFNCGVIPGYSLNKLREDLIAKFDYIQVEIEDYLEIDEPKETRDFNLIPLLKEAIYQFDEKADAITYLMPSFTDADIYEKLGVQTYGFLPMDLPKEFNIWDYIHSENEQVPIRALEFGEQVLGYIVSKYGG